MSHDTGRGSAAMTAALSVARRHPDLPRTQLVAELRRHHAVRMYLRGYGHARHDDVLNTMIECADAYLIDGQLAQIVALFERQTRSAIYQRLKVREQRLHRVVFMRLTVTGEGGSTILAPYRALILMLDLEYGEKLGPSAIGNSLTRLAEAGLVEVTRGTRSYGGTSTKVSVRNLLEPATGPITIEAYLNLTMQAKTFEALAQFRQGRRAELGRVRRGQGHLDRDGSSAGVAGLGSPEVATAALSGTDAVGTAIQALEIEELGRDIATMLEPHPG